MIIIQDVLVSDDIVEEHFVCDLNRCKGACCWDGDYGAPVTPKEEESIKNIYPKIKDQLDPEAVRIIEEEGLFKDYNKGKFRGTNLMKNGACVFMTKNELGYAQCGFESYYDEEKSDFKKPISCHLYPIRVSENKSQGFTALNYDRWDICNAACNLGKSLKTPIYRFVKEAIIRKFGQGFYDELEAYAEWNKNKPTS